jgi:hypothetical protein
MIMFAFAPSELTTACRAVSVSSVIHVREMSRAVGSVSRKTLSIMSSRFGLAISGSRRGLSVDGFHRAFAVSVSARQARSLGHFDAEVETAIMFVEKESTRLCKNR